MAQLHMPGVLSLVLFVTGISFLDGQENNGIVGATVTVVNLCDKRPGVEPNGEHLAKAGDVLKVYTNWINNTPTSNNRCLMRFSTCSNCSLHVQADVAFHYSPCSSAEAYNEYDGWCVPGCSYIHMYDKDYSNQTAQTFTSSSTSVNGYPRQLDFITTSRFLYVIACANKSQDANVFFQLNITSKEKVQYFSSDSGNDGIFTSPFFPSEYVLNLEKFKYVFTAAEPDDYITISFDDWQLSQYSTIQFDKASIRGTIWGSNNRPWIISDGPQLEMIFDTGPFRIPGQLRAFKGFKANYTFHNLDRDELPSVRTNCGLWIDQQEMGLIMFNPLGDGQNYYDCIWVIKKHPDFQRIMIKVLNFTTEDQVYRVKQPSILEVREGVTSVGRQVIYSDQPGDNQKYMDFDSNVGFYVRLQGHFWRRKDFMLAFTSFNLDQCIYLFWCKNGRCVPKDAQCNGIDNCGDNSDESIFICGTAQPPSNSESGKNFLSPVVIIPLVVAVFAIVVICLLIIFICRCRRMSREASRAQRRQLRISTISGGAAVEHSRRHNRRRGDPRQQGSLNHHHMDLPPSYEDVLSTTPIGYLNLGFAHSDRQSTGLIQPPSYDEATSPTATQAPSLTYPSIAPQDESSDSSMQETAQRSLSTSYSSDDTQRPRGDQHRRHGPVSSSSSDSSNESEMFRGEALDRQRRGRGAETGCTEREGDRQTEGRQMTARYSLPKQEACVIALPDEIAQNKIIQPNNKPKPSGENPTPAVTTESSATASSSSPCSQNHSSLCRVELSPLVFAPSISLERQGARYEEGEGRTSSAGPNAVSSLPPTNSSQGPLPGYPPREGQNITSLRENSHPKEARPSPSRRIPAHILKARNAASHKLMKNLSRSMNDLHYQPSERGSDGHIGAMPSRHFSRSMQNLLEGPADEHHRDSERCLSKMNQPYHHRSQTLPTPQDMLNHAAEPEGRSSFFPADGQGRRSRSDDIAGQAGPNALASHAPSDPRHREQSRPEVQQNDRAGMQAGEETALPATRTKPMPKPRRLHPPRGRSGPEPRQRRSLEGPRNLDHTRRPNEWSIPHSSQSRPPPPPANHRSDRQRSNSDQDGSGQNVSKNYERRDHGSQQMERVYPLDNKNASQQNVMPRGPEDTRQPKSIGPSAPTRSHGPPRPSSRGRDCPDRNDCGDGRRYEPGRDHPPGSLYSHSTGSPPLQQGNSSSYRLRGHDELNRLTSNPQLATDQNQSTYDRNNATSNRNQATSDRSRAEGTPRPRHPPYFTQNASRSAGLFQGSQSMPRSGQQMEGVTRDDRSHLSGTGGDPQQALVATLPLLRDPGLTPHLPLSGALNVTSAMSSSVNSEAAPFLSLRLGGQEEEEQEDVYV